jgi:creatinine amidohydrolase/Fe(II)-dependent formamide hydrolase-like protein
VAHHLDTLSAPRLREVIDSGIVTVVVPFGSIEHQGGHLPIGADSILADTAGGEVAERLPAVLAPTLSVGCAEQHQNLLGTMTLRATTLTALAVEQAQSLARQRFQVVVLLSTHGGNRGPLDAAVAVLDRSLQDVVTCAPRGDVGPNPGRHSGTWLTSVMLALRPDLVELDRADPELRAELLAVDSKQGSEALERFIASIVAGVRATTSG